jgi:superfamily I DNA and RNA helicase
MWKGYWGNSEQILLIHKINAGKVYFTHAWGDENKSAERMGEIRKDTDIYFFNYTTPGGQFSLSCKKGEAKMQGRRTISSSKMGSEVLGSFQKVK